MSFLPAPLQEMSDLKKYNPPPGSSDLYLAASKHFQQAKLILENVLSPDPEVRKLLQIISCCSILQGFFFLINICLSLSLISSMNNNR